jgi:hypothetical protein
MRPFERGLLQLQLGRPICTDHRPFEREELLWRGSLTEELLLQLQLGRPISTDHCSYTSSLQQEQLFSATATEHGTPKKRFQRHFPLPKGLTDQSGTATPTATGD